MNTPLLSYDISVSPLPPVKEIAEGGDHTYTYSYGPPSHESSRLSRKSIIKRGLYPDQHGDMATSMFRRNPGKSIFSSGNLADL